MKGIFSSESVTKGHPDKVCDQISDAVLDALLSQDSLSRCACEVTAEPGAVHIMGEITTRAKVDYEEVARRTIREIGYTKEEYGFTDRAAITCSVHEQSADIARGVDRSFSDSSTLGAGDQGMMFGYASADGDEYMPLAQVLSRRLSQGLTRARESGLLPWLRPDGKTQVSVRYEEGRPSSIASVVLSAQHDPEVSLEELRETLKEKVILPSLPEELLRADTRFFINPTGRFVLGGPAADTGLTGRKIIADTYGGYAHHGGGAFSGKDPTKVDRSAALVLRNIAKTIVASGAAYECELQAAYAIGVAEPVSLCVETFGTSRLPESELIEWARKSYDLRPEAMIERFGLRRPLYLKAASEGSFGRTDVTFPWEVVDRTALDSLREKL